MPCWPAVSTITLFPRLEEVRLENGAVPLLDYISAPSLSSVMLRGSREEEVEERQALSVLSKFAYRQDGCPRLRSLALLSVAWDGFTTENAVACLRHLPSLEHLHIAKIALFEENGHHMGHPLDIPFARALTRDPATPASLELLPRLTSLILCIDEPKPL
ncbi:hypothetical protein BD626DRAFT_473192 [Schizophyllum amplum]|uniref:F-box domain-containing protein n=1 Tax=Schizophyllum amplum TaxID=97359 RepID=A0A550CWK5_9AGAR|nr:hypothetical protein BD626DRAFT_473192 [Auriculariopsis ampla]